MLATLLASHAAHGQLLKLHCGDLNGYAAEEPGYVLLSESVMPPGVSLFPPPLDTVHVATWSPALPGVPWPSNVATIDPGALSASHRFTSLVLADDSVLTLDGFAPNTGYRIRLELGALAPWMEFAPPGGWQTLPSVSRDVRVDVQTPATTSPPVSWTTVADHVRCSTGHTASSFTTDWGGLTSVWFRCRSDSAGRLRLRFATGGDDPVLLCSVEVHGGEALPVIYRHTPAGPLQAQTPGVAGFVAAFNAGDLDAAQEAALALPDAWERGVSLLHLVGWLDGTRDGRVVLIPQAQAALQQAQAAGHAGAPWLLAQLEPFTLALDHLAARGYSAGKLCPAQGGPGFLNPDCAGQIWPSLGSSEVNVNAHIALRELTGFVAGRGAGPTVLTDLAAWNAGTLGADVFEPSPLVFRALEIYGDTLAGINPQQAVTADPESVEFHQRMLDVFNGFVDLGFFASDFPQEVELLLLQAFAAAGSHPNDWPASQVKVLSDAQIDGSWWGADVAAPPTDRDAPAWADAQHAFVAQHRSIARYWLTQRLSDGEFGGGQGDDVELLLQFWPALAGVRDQRDAALLARLQDAIRHDLDECDCLKDGYYGGAYVDVEHNAEFTTDPFLTETGVFGPTARALRTALGVVQHFKDGGGPGAFAAPTVLGRWHFRSSVFNADGPSPTYTPTLDTLLDGRAMAPGTYLALRAPVASGHPLPADLRDWATAWRLDALDTSASANGKPTGFLGPIASPTNEFGTAGLWYSSDGSPTDSGQFANGEMSYEIELLRMAYRTSTAADRWTYLVPAARLFRTVQLWEDAGKPTGPTGSSNWAAAAVKNGARFGPMVIDSLGPLSTDPVLPTMPDPYLGGTKAYVDAALLARMRTWVQDEYTDQSSAMHYALPPVFPCDQHAAKTTTGLVPPYTAASDYYRNWFPLLTARVLHTDRVLANLDAVYTHLAAGVTGGMLAEGLAFEPRLRWRAPSGGWLDLAVHTNLRDETGVAHSAFVYNFAAAPAAVEALLDAGLTPGAWHLELGAADGTCDVFKAGDLLSTDIVVQKPGAGKVVPLVLPTGLSLLRLTRTGPATGAAPAFDYALDAPRVELHVATDLTLSLKLSARVANAGAAAAPPASVSFWIETVAPDGATLLPGGFPLTSPVVSPSFTLPATTAWIASETTASATLSLPAAAGPWLLAGNGLQVRAAISSAPDADGTNDSQSRVEFLSTVALVMD